MMISKLMPIFRDHFIKVVLIVLFCHLLFGFVQTPSSVLTESINRGYSPYIARIGYSLGIFVLFGIILPVSLFILSLLYKIVRKNNDYSVKNRIIQFSLISLALNIFYGFLFIPFIIRSSNHMF
jgi:hypothetical protein